MADTADPRVADLTAWLSGTGLVGASSTELLDAYCHKLVALGMPLMRVQVTLTAVHPEYGGIGFEWENQTNLILHEYEHNAEVPDSWINSPFHHMASTGITAYRERMYASPTPSRFPLLAEMQARGATDYIASMVLFQPWETGRPIALEDRVEGAILSWMAHADTGFSDRDAHLIETTAPILCLVLKSQANRKTAVDLLGIYLGEDAGRRVLNGEIERGSTQWIDAVICYFDLEGFTAMSQQIAGEALIDMLNVYFARVVAHIEAQGGNVLKFMGDGLLAIFDRTALSDAPDRALAATQAIDADMAGLHAARTARNLPAMGYTMALHAGRVLYGNIGADRRLDFTVIGPEVNMAARIAGMHKALGQKVILSEPVRAGARAHQDTLVSLGRYMLRGVDRPCELFTLFSEPSGTP